MKIYGYCKQCSDSTLVNGDQLCEDCDKIDKHVGAKVNVEKEKHVKMKTIKTYRRKK